MRRESVWKLICYGALVALGFLAAGIYLFSPKGMEASYSDVPQRTVVIDPGHGGEDGGAVAPDGTLESALNLEIAKRLDFLLTFCGQKTLLLREDDISLHDSEANTIREKKVSDIHNRVDTINAQENPAVISIHQNFFLSSKYHGAQVFYANGPLSQPWAEQTQKDLIAYLDPANHRSATPISQDIYLMNHIRCPAILVECGFLSNPEEREKLKTPDYQRKLALIIAGAYLQSINEGGTTENGTQSEESILLYPVRK